MISRYILKGPSGLKIFPAILNNLSTGADVAGVAMYFLAALVNN
jgi:hypothetical protein